MEQAVIVKFRLSDAQFCSKGERDLLQRLGDKLGRLVERSGVGEFDGDDVGEGEYCLFFYCRDANKLLEKIYVSLSELQWPRRVLVIKRYGQPGAEETQMELAQEPE